MNTIVITPDEKARQRFEPARLEQAVKSVQEHGYVILENCVAREHADLKTNAVFIDEPIDYLHRHAAFDLKK